jgi:hypothetical protein
VGAIFAGAAAGGVSSSFEHPVITKVNARATKSPVLKNFSFIII